MTKNAIRLWWAQAILVCILIGSTIFNVSYTNQVDERSRRENQVESRQNDRRWCDLLKALDDSYQNPANPPTTALGRQIAAAVHELKVEFGC